MQHLMKWNHFEFKPKVDLAVYENGGMPWFGWMKVFDLVEQMFFVLLIFFLPVEIVILLQ